MKRTNNNPDEAQMRQIRDTAQRESHPYNDERANYPFAEQHREQRAEGAALRHAA